MHCIAFRSVMFCSVMFLYIILHHIVSHYIVLHQCMHEYIQKCRHIDIQAYIHAYTRTKMHTWYMHACIHACMHPSIYPSMHACIHSNMQAWCIPTYLLAYIPLILQYLEVCNSFFHVFFYASSLLNKWKNPFLATCRVSQTERRLGRRWCTVWWWTVSPTATSRMIRATSPHSSSRTEGNQLLSVKNLHVRKLYWDETKLYWEFYRGFRHCSTGCIGWA